jgi:pimeloyl-ACP methyl ester carboxylesterase
LRNQLNIQQWRLSGAYFTFNNQQIFYKDTLQTDSDKNKQTLLLIHGFPTSSWDWMKIWPELNKSYRLITLDLLGFGFSDKPYKKYSIFEQADICQALLTKLNVSHYHIIAHDYGDTVAQELLARDVTGEQIQSCNLTNGGLFPETHHSLPIQTLLISPLGFLFPLFYSKFKLKQNLDNICFIPLSESEISANWQLICHNKGKRIIHKIIRYMRERIHNRTRWVNALINTEVPLHLINGVLDPISGEHMVVRYEELIPKPNVTRLHQVGHYPHVESPSKFAKVCIRFIENHSNPAL